MENATESSGSGLGLAPGEAMAHSLAQGQHRKGLSALLGLMLLIPEPASKPLWVEALGLQPGCSAHVLYNSVMTLGPTSNISKYRKLFPCCNFPEKCMLFF